MQVVMFIGHHKVGSSTLQTFLARNAVALLRHGILYPSVEAEGMSLALRDALRGKSDRYEPLSFNVREPHNALAFRLLNEKTGTPVPPIHTLLPASHQMFHLIQKQIEALQPKAVIFCSEVFSNFGGSAPELITTLKEILPLSNVRILCTLRRPDEYLASWHGQRLRFGHKVRALRNAGAAPYFDGIHFDYKLMLAPWRAAFPDADFVVRNYHDVLKGGGSVQDFITQSGIVFPKGLHTTPNRNPGIPYALMEIVRQIIHTFPKPHDLFTPILQKTARFDMPPNSEIEMFGAQNRALMMEEFAPIHAYLAQFAKGDLFFPTIADVAVPRRMPELEAVRHVLPQVQRYVKRTLEIPELEQLLSEIEASV